jgi:ATPase subunit of ABC transporter with duplicated ATPase domains
VDAVATRILEITPEGVEDFPGTYAEFLAKQEGPDHLDADAVAERAKEERREKKRQKRKKKELSKKQTKPGNN